MGQRRLTTIARSPIIPGTGMVTPMRILTPVTAGIQATATVTQAAAGTADIAASATRVIAVTGTVDMVVTAIGADAVMGSTGTGASTGTVAFMATEGARQGSTRLVVLAGHSLSPVGEVPSLRAPCPSAATPADSAGTQVGSVADTAEAIASHPAPKTAPMPERTVWCVRR